MVYNAAAFVSSGRTNVWRRYAAGNMAYASGPRGQERSPNLDWNDRKSAGQGRRRATKAARSRAQLHMRRNRMAISTVSLAGLWPAVLAPALGQAQLSKRSSMGAVMKRVRAAYMWRSPLLFC